MLDGSFDSKQLEARHVRRGQGAQQGVQNREASVGFFLDDSFRTMVKKSCSEL